MERRAGLMIKRRSHFTNTYAPFCPDCGQSVESRKALQTHLAMAHGKRLVPYKRRESAAGPQYVSRPINIESLGLEGKVLDQYLPDMKRIWRLSKVGNTNLILVERIKRKAPKVKALYSICLVIVTRGLEEATATAPKRMRRVAEHVRQHADLVLKIQEQKRYARLKLLESKAKLLCLGMEHPAFGLTNPAHANAKHRDFPKSHRTLVY